MKPLVLALLTFVLPCSNVDARIGETVEQLKTRYGDGQKANQPRLPGTEKYVFKKDGFTIDVSFYKGLSVLEFFHRDDTKITDDDIKDLLKNYVTGVRFVWSQRDRVFKSTGEKKMTAGREPGHDDWVFVKDTAAMEELAEASKGKAKGL